MLVRCNHEINCSCLMNQIKCFWKPWIQILDGIQNFLDVMRYNWINPFCSYNLNSFVALIGPPIKSYSLYSQNNRQQVHHSKTPEVKLKPSFYIGLDLVAQIGDKFISIFCFSHAKCLVENHATM